MTASAPAASTDLLIRFEAFIEALCRCVAAEGSRHRIAGPLVILIWTRLRRLAERFSRLVSHPRSVRPTQKSGKSGGSKKLPRGFAWLLRLMPATAAIASQLRHMLTEPEMAEFIATTPQAGRILRPLCHTLGIRTFAPPLALPPRPKKPRKPAQRISAPTETTTSRDPPEPSPFAPQPDLPGWPRAPGAMRFFPKRVLRPKRITRSMP